MIQLMSFIHVPGLIVQNTSVHMIKERNVCHFTLSLTFLSFDVYNSQWIKLCHIQHFPTIIHYHSNVEGKLFLARNSCFYSARILYMYKPSLFDPLTLTLSILILFLKKNCYSTCISLLFVSDSEYYCLRIFTALLIK